MYGLVKNPDLYDLEEKMYVEGIDGSIQYRGTGVHGFAENAITFADIAAENFKAWPASRLIYGNSGNFFRGAIKVSDTPVQIQREYTIRDVVQYDLILIVEAFVRRGRFLRILFMNLRRRNGFINAMAGFGLFGFTLFPLQGR